MKEKKLSNKDRATYQLWLANLAGMIYSIQKYWTPHRIDAVIPHLDKVCKILKMSLRRSGNE